MSINSFFEKVYCINLDRRTDRWAQAQAEAAKYGIVVERHSGVEVEYPSGKRIPPEVTAERVAKYGVKLEGFPGEKPFGQMGTTLAHRMLMRKIAEGSASRALILEDDFYVLRIEDKPSWFGVDAGPVPIEFQARFDYLIPYVPTDWDLVYLGGGYGSKPKARASKHCILVDTMMTTSSYGVTKKYAKEWSDFVDDAEDKMGAARYATYMGPIDSLFNGFPLKGYKHYAIQPRLIVQRMDYSDANQRVENYIGSQTDDNHEKMV